MGKTIIITEKQYKLIREGLEREITFYEFAKSVKGFLKQLLDKPSEAEVDNLLHDEISKKELLKSLKDLGMLNYTEKIEEVEDEVLGKKVGKRFIQYSIPKTNFNDKMHKLYNSIIKESKSVFSNEDAEVEKIKKMDSNGDYKKRGGLRKEDTLNETDCAGVGAVGDGSDSSGQYATPFSAVQRKQSYKSFWKKSLSRNKNEDNKSISINKKK